MGSCKINLWNGVLIMELCKISHLSSYHKHYKDQIFVVVNRDKEMVNIKYRKFPDDEHFTGICVPVYDINVIQLDAKT